MKKFLINTILYSILLLGLCYCLCFIADSGLKKAQINEVYDWNKIVNGTINADVLITGSSRAMRMIDPEKIGNTLNMSAYNIGMEGARLHTQMTRWDSYMKYNSTPQIVVQTVDLMSMGHGKTIFKKQQFLPFLNETTVYDRLKKLDKRLFLDRYFPLYKYHGYFDEFKKGMMLFFGLSTNDNYTMYKGYEAKDKSFNNEFQQMKDTLSQNRLLHPENLIVEGFDHLKYIAKDCSQRNIKLVLVLTPQYSGLTELQVQLDNLVKDFEEMAINNDNIHFLNYLNAPYCNDTAFFYNAMHLNLKGANAFSEELALDLKGIAD